MSARRSARVRWREMNNGCEQARWAGRTQKDARPRLAVSVSRRSADTETEHGEQNRKGHGDTEAMQPLGNPQNTTSGWGGWASTRSSGEDAAGYSNETK